MPSLLRSIREGRAAARDPARAVPMSLDDYSALVTSALDDWNMSGAQPFEQTWAREPAERVGTAMADLARTAYKGNGLAFACISVRMTAFSLVRFSWQRIRAGRPGDLFGTPALMPLEVPWPGGTTQDLLQRMLLDVDLAGNAYVVRDGPWLLRLRPDWVQILLEPVEMNGGIVGYRRYGYTYHNGGVDTCPPERIALFAASEVAHFAPLPDPDASYRGMSWLNAATREVSNDKSFERHKQRFLENAATPNLTVSLDKMVSPADFAEFKEKMEVEHRGVENVGKTLYLGGGADVKVVGSNFQQLQINDVQGRGETRVAAAAGVPAVIVGLSEGLSSATYSNYGLAMRRFAELTMASLWGNAAGSLATILRPPGGDARLWYDTRDVSFLREDRKSAAEVQAQQAQTIRTLLDAGYTPESVVAAVNAEDFTMLEHSGLYSVQLQAPGSGTPAASDPPADDSDDDSGSDSGGDSAGGSAPAASTNSRLPVPFRASLGPLDEVDRVLAAADDHPALPSTNGAHP